MPLIGRKRPAMSQATARVRRGADSNIIEFCVYTYIARSMAAQQTTHTATAAPVGEG